MRFKNVLIAVIDSFAVYKVEKNKSAERFNIVQIKF